MKTFASVTGECRLMAAIVAGVAVVFASTSGQAQPITGSISFTGGADLNGSLAAATAYTGFFDTVSIPSPVVLGGSQTGSFATVPSGTQVTFYPFVFQPFTAPQLLWSFAAGGETYSFTAISLVNATPPSFSSSYLNLQGNGVISITGATSFSPTTASWSYTDTGTGSGPGFNFGASITATPEPSTTSLIAVLALVGCGFRIAARRKSCSRAGVS
jgi:hypothetical protein